ncbi:MAG TPA: hypothetical protein VK712_01580 [Verrucomicrobiae bacterium]|jgi:hypothetical protein|nr:hypothetical protein [Verrucomicrobiae bacterium]
MKPTEARVFIIEDDARKLERLTEFVETNGGQVVGTVNNREDAHGVVNDPEFPVSVGNANTVLIDGNLDEHDRHGTDGQYIFLDGFRRGVLHRVDSNDGIGAVAIGSSIDSRSDVAYATGGNLDKTYEEEAATRWADFLAPHPAEPLYLSEGSLERMDWSGGFRFGEMMKHVIKPEDNPTVKVHFLAVTETKKEGEEETVTYTDEVTTPTEVSLEGFVTKAGDWQGVEDGYIKVDSHTVKALVQAGEYVYAISHSGRVVKSSWGSDLANGGKTDKISIAALSEVPDSYWQSLGVERPSV